MYQVNNIQNSFDITIYFKVFSILPYKHNKNYDYKNFVSIG